MTVTTTSPRVDYTGTNATPTYAFPFRILQDSDLLLIQTDLADVETVLALGTDYTVTGAGAYAGGSITLTAGNLPTGYGLAIKRVMDIKQTTSIRNQSAFFPEVHEAVFDRLTMIDQQQQEQIDRCFKLDPSATAGSVESPSAVPGYALGWDALGNLTSVPNTGAAQTLAWTAADAVVAADAAVATALVRADLASAVNAAKGPALIGFDDALAYPAGTVGEDLVLPRPVSRGGTGGASASAALANLGIMDVANEITINTSVAMDNSYLNKSIVFGSAGAFYSPVLPASAPNGSYISVRVSMAMAYIVVLTAGGSDTIDGATTRRIRAGECWTLLKTSTGWIKIQGLSRPYNGSMCRKTSQTAISTGAFTAVDWTSVVGDALCLDGSARFRAPRAGVYQVEVSLNIIVTNPTTIGQFGLGLAKNGTVLTTDPSCYVELPIPVLAGSQRVGAHTGGTFILATDDYIETMVRVISTAATFDVNSVTPTLDPTLNFVEVAPW